MLRLHHCRYVVYAVLGLQFQNCPAKNPGDGSGVDAFTRHAQAIPDHCKEYTDYPASEEFSVVSAKCGKQYILWLTKANMNKGNDQVASNIADRRLVGVLKRGDVFVSGPFCYDKGDREIYLSAVMRWHGQKKIRPGNEVIIDAWKPDLGQGRFVRIPRADMKAIRCTISDD